MYLQNQLKPCIFQKLIQDSNTCSKLKDLLKWHIILHENNYSNFIQPDTWTGSANNLIHFSALAINMIFKSLAMCNNIHFTTLAMSMPNVY